MKSAFKIFILTAVALSAATQAKADNLRIASDTLVKYFAQEKADGKNKTGIPAYEYMQLDAGQLGDSGMSAHLYGWGRYEFGDFIEDETQGELLYAYGQYKLSPYNFSAMFGRHYLSQGVFSSSLDGLSLASDLGPYLSWAAFGGLPVTLETVEGRDGDKVYGGTVSHHFSYFYNIQASYKKVDNDGKEQEEFLGLDSSLTPWGPIGIFGKSVRNQASGEWSQHSYEARLSYWGFLLRPTFQKVYYDHLFDTGFNTAKPFSSPFGLTSLSRSGEEVTLKGIEGSYTVNPFLEIGAKYKNYDYKLRADKADYYGGQVAFYGSGLTQAGLEAGRMDGKSDLDRYLLARAYFYLDASLFILSSDVTYAKYSQNFYGPNGEDQSLQATLGGGLKLLEDALKIKIQGEYSKDPNFENDLRGILSVEFDYSK